jgi:predicted HTH domain antitoxin
LPELPEKIDDLNLTIPQSPPLTGDQGNRSLSRPVDGDQRRFSRSTYTDDFDKIDLYYLRCTIIHTPFWKGSIKMEVVFPNELLVALKEEPDSFRQKVLLYTLGKLYELGRISGGFGAKMLGCDRWEFYRLLSENGFAVIDYPDEELEREASIDDVWYEQAQKA